MDEATAALDSASESIVQKALDKAAKNRTTVAIAHRLSTIKNANQIIVMGGGEILEVGDHNSLTANPDGAYSSLVAAQSLTQAKSNEAAQMKTGTVEKEAEEDEINQEDVIPIDRVKSGHSITSQILEKRREKRVNTKRRIIHSSKSLFNWSSSIRTGDGCMLLVQPVHLFRVVSIFPYFYSLTD